MESSKFKKPKKEAQVSVSTPEPKKEVQRPVLVPKPEQSDSKSKEQENIPVPNVIIDGADTKQ